MCLSWNNAFKLCCHVGCALKPVQCTSKQISVGTRQKNSLRVCLGGKVEPSLASSGSSSWRNFPRGYHWLAISQLAKRASQTCERKCKRQSRSTSVLATIIHVFNVRSVPMTIFSCVQSSLRATSLAEFSASHYLLQSKNQSGKCCCGVSGLCEQLSFLMTRSAGLLSECICGQLM